jgi:hypothetical protein
LILAKQANSTIMEITKQSLILEQEPICVGGIANASRLHNVCSFPLTVNAALESVSNLATVHCKHPENESKDDKVHDSREISREGGGTKRAVGGTSVMEEKDANTTNSRKVSINPHTEASRFP